MKKQSFWSKVGAFLAGRGFYMVLVLCLAVIGGSGWFLWQEYRSAAEEASAAAKVTITEEASSSTADASQEETGKTAKKDTETAKADSKETETGTAKPAMDTAEEATTEAAEATASPAESEEEKAAASQKEDTDAAPVTAPEKAAEDAKSTAGTTEKAEAKETEATESEGWLWPLKGEVVATFSTDTLTYNEALGDWRTHNGVDLSAGLGDDVVSACGGTVLTVEDDLLLGKTVSVDCGNGVTAIYGNLAEECNVVAGDKVAAGDVLGVVGATALGESSGPAWLHFAVEENGVAVDPMTYLN